MSRIEVYLGKSCFEGAVNSRNERLLQTRRWGKQNWL